MATLSAGSSYTFGLNTDQTLTINTDDSDAGYVTLTRLDGGQHRINFGPERKKDFNPFPDGKIGKCTIYCTIGSLDYTISTSYFPAFSKDTNGNVTGLIDGNTAVSLGSPIPNVIKASSLIKKPILGFAGDSIMNGAGQLNFVSSALCWVLAKDYHADVVINTNTYANGGYNFAVGGAGTSAINTTQTPQIVARPPHILFLNGGTNDGISDVTGATTAYTNMTTLCDAALAAGVELIIFFPVGPKSNVTLTSGECQAIAEYNYMMRNYADATDGVYYFDYIDLFLDPASSTYGAIGGSAGLAGAVTADGLHNSGTGTYLQSAMLYPIISKVTRERKPSFINQADIFHATNNFHGNILGTTGHFLGTNGTLNAVANAGVAASWAITTANGLIVTPSKSTSIAPMPVGFTTQKLTLSGTVSGGTGNFTVARTAYSATYFTGLPRIQIECVVRCNNLSGIYGLKLVDSIGGGTAVSITAIGAGFGTTIADEMPTGDYHVFLYTPFDTQSVTGNIQHTIQIVGYAVNGKTVSGSIELMFCGIRNIT